MELNQDDSLIEIAGDSIEELLTEINAAITLGLVFTIVKETSDAGDGSVIFFAHASNRLWAQFMNRKDWR